MSCSIRRRKVLLDQTAAGNGPWIRLDSRYEDSPERAIQISLTAGDSVRIEGTTLDIRGEGDPTDTIAAEDIAILDGSFSSSTSTILNGNWTYIRVVKTGSSGNAKVQGFV